MDSNQIYDHNFDKSIFPHVEQVVIKMENFEYYSIANNIIFCAEYDDGTIKETLYKYLVVNTEMPFFAKLTTFFKFLFFYWRKPCNNCKL